MFIPVDLPASFMLQNVAHLIKLLSRTEMVLSCLQDQLLVSGASPFSGSTMEMMRGLGPLLETGTISKADDCLPRVYSLLKGYCTPDETILATRAFLKEGPHMSNPAMMPAHISPQTLLQRILRRKSLWCSCSRSTAASIEEIAHGFHVPELKVDGSCEKHALALRQLLLNEITLERTMDSQRRLLAAHKDFNVISLFSILRAYDDSSRKNQEVFPRKGHSRNRRRQQGIVTADAIVRFCADHGVVLKKWHVRALLSRYSTETISDRVKRTLSASNRSQHLGNSKTVPSPAVPGLTFDEFTGMLLECRIEWQRSAVEWQRRICDDRRDVNGENALDAAVAEAVLFRSGPDGTEIGSNVVRAHLKTKYLASRVLLSGSLLVDD